MVAVGGDGGICQAYNDGGLRARCGGAHGPSGRQGDDRHGGLYAAEVVAVRSGWHVGQQTRQATCIANADIQVVHGGMGDAQQLEGIATAVFGIAVVLGELEAEAWLQLAHRAFAMESDAVQRQGLLHPAGLAAGVVGVLQLALTTAVENLECGHGLGCGRIAGAGGVGQQLLGMPAGAHHGVGAHGLAGAECGNGVVLFGGVHAVEADALKTAGQGRGLGGGVEHHQLVAGAQAAVGIAFGRIFLAMGEVPAQALRRQQAGEEVEVGFAVLGADGTGQQRLGSLPLQAGLGVVGQQLSDDLLGGLVLEDVAVAAQAQEREKGLQPQPVAGHAAVGAQPCGIGAVAVPGALAAVGLQ